MTMETRVMGLDMFNNVAGQNRLIVSQYVPFI